MERSNARRLAAVAAGLAIAAAALAVPGSAGATPAGPSPTTTQLAPAPTTTPSAPAPTTTSIAPVPTATPPVPAEAIAGALGELGQTTYRKHFAGLTVDKERGRVTVHSTNRDWARKMVAQAGARAGVTVELADAKYARAQLEQTSARLWARAGTWKSAGAQIFSIVLLADGSGLEVRTDDPAKLAALVGAPAALAGTPVAAADVTTVKGQPVKGLSRDDPSPPYQGGIPVRWDWSWSHYDCTTAFAVYRPGAPEYLLTAEHCFDLTDWIEDANGDIVGVLREENTLRDAAVIETDGQPWAFVDGNTVRAVRAARYSWNGESVCQSGRTSLPNRCGIVVTHELVQWQDDEGDIRYGVEGRRCGGCAAADKGDSGGPVWSLRSDGALDARGIVSAGSVEVDGGYEYLYWTEIPAVLNEMRLQLQTF